jgi:hypothetical protein
MLIKRSLHITVYPDAYPEESAATQDFFNECAMLRLHPLLLLQAAHLPRWQHPGWGA